MATQIRAGQQLGSWTVDTAETFSRPRAPQEPLATAAWTREYEVRRFEIDRSQQIATNVVGGLLGAATCLLGSSEQCMGMALQQGRGRASGSYSLRRLSLDCSARFFDVSDDPFGPQPIERDGKGQAAVLAKRDCPDLPASAGAT